MVSNKKFSLFILLLSGFIDYVGIALVYPLFAYMLFDPQHSFLPLDTSATLRGFWLGILLALLPLAQFFSCPLLGALSDQRGRKKLLLLTLLVALIGYTIAVIGALTQSLILLALYRILVGIAGGNASIVSAIIADLSAPEEKAKHYGFLSMAFGAGFTIGPFLGGFLADYFAPSGWGLLAPFLIALSLVSLNLLLVYYRLPETRPKIKKERVNWFLCITQVKQGFSMEHLRGIFLALLVYTLGWSFFTEFIPLFLIDRYGFAPKEIGYYYGYTGLFYGLAAGFFIQPVLRFMKARTLLHSAFFLSGGYVLLLLFIYNPKLLWFYLPLSQCFIAFVYPTTSALISNRVSDEVQGEVLGIYQAVIALALAVCPLCSGIFVGWYPILSVVIGGVVMLLAGFLFHFYDKKTVKEPSD